MKFKHPVSCILNALVVEPDLVIKHLESPVKYRFAGREIVFCQIGEETCEFDQFIGSCEEWGCFENHGTKWRAVEKICQVPDQKMSMFRPRLMNSFMTWGAWNYISSGGDLIDYIVSSIQVSCFCIVRKFKSCFENFKTYYDLCMNCERNQNRLRAKWIDEKKIVWAYSAKSLSEKPLEYETVLIYLFTVNWYFMNQYRFRFTMVLGSGE